MYCEIQEVHGHQVQTMWYDNGNVWTHLRVVPFSEAEQDTMTQLTV